MSLGNIFKYILVPLYLVHSKSGDNVWQLVSTKFQIAIEDVRRALPRYIVYKVATVMLGILFIVTKNPSLALITSLVFFADIIFGLTVIKGLMSGSSIRLVQGVHKTMVILLAFTWLIMLIPIFYGVYWYVEGANVLTELFTCFHIVTFLVIIPSILSKNTIKPWVMVMTGIVAILITAFVWISIPVKDANRGLIQAVQTLIASEQNKKAGQANKEAAKSDTEAELLESQAENIRVLPTFVADEDNLVFVMGEKGIAVPGGLYITKGQECPIDMNDSLKHPRGATLYMALDKDTLEPLGYVRPESFSRIEKDEDENKKRQKGDDEDKGELEESEWVTGDMPHHTVNNTKTLDSWVIATDIVRIKVSADIADYMKGLDGKEGTSDDRPVHLYLKDDWVTASLKDLSRHLNNGGRWGDVNLGRQSRYLKIKLPYKDRDGYFDKIKSIVTSTRKGKTQMSVIEIDFAN